MVLQYIIKMGKYITTGYLTTPKKTTFEIVNVPLLV